MAVIPSGITKTRGQFPLDRLNIRKCAIVGFAWIFAGHIGRCHDVDLMAKMIECQQSVKKHQHAIGKVQVVFSMLADVFKPANNVVRTKSYRSSGKWRQAGNVRQLVLLQKPFSNLEYIALTAFDFFSALNRNLSTAGAQLHVRAGTQECVPPNLLAAFYRFE